MIIKSDLATLPPALQKQYATELGRDHKLWRLVEIGLNTGDLANRIDFHACTDPAVTPVKQFRVTIGDTDPLALRINELAEAHRAAKRQVFEILVKLGWESLQKPNLLDTSTASHSSQIGMTEGAVSAHAH